MKKLDYLENYDVVALDEEKTKEIDGGIGGILKWFILAYSASVLSDTDGHAEAFKRGYQKGLE